MQLVGYPGEHDRGQLHPSFVNEYPEVFFLKKLPRRRPLRYPIEGCCVCKAWCEHCIYRLLGPCRPVAVRVHTHRQLSPPPHALLMLLMQPKIPPHQLHLEVAVTCIQWGFNCQYRNRCQGSQGVLHITSTRQSPRCEGGGDSSLQRRQHYMCGCMEVLI